MVGRGNKNVFRVRIHLTRIYEQSCISDKRCTRFRENVMSFDFDLSHKIPGTFYALLPSPFQAFSKGSTCFDTDVKRDA